MAKKIFSQNPEKYVLALAEKLKELEEFQVPEWANFVKSGTSRERPPTQVDFWYVRGASILRQLYIKGVVGVNRLRTRYGSRKDRGGRPDEFRRASGKLIRVILQQAEKAGLVEKVTHLQHGRRLTQKGRDFLDSIEVFADDLMDLSSVLVHKSATIEENGEHFEESEGDSEEDSEEDSIQEESEEEKPALKKEKKKKVEVSQEVASEDEKEKKEESLVEETKDEPSKEELPQDAKKEKKVEEQKEEVEENVETVVEKIKEKKEKKE